MTDTEKNSPQTDQMNATVKWDDSKMQTTYANVVNASSTREEVSVFFGTNQTWNVTEDKEFSIQLSHRVVLNPYAAKRLAILMGRLVQEYEKRFGTLAIDVGDQTGAGKAAQQANS